MKYFKKIVGERIYLAPRVAGEEEAEKFAEWLNEFKTTDYLGRSGAIITFQGEKEYLEKAEKDDKNYVFYIVAKDGDKLIGTIGLESIKNIERYATLGVFIGDKEFRNNGYGTEAIKLLLDYGFNYLNLHGVKLNVMAFNEIAIKCYEKCGFKKAGRVRESTFVNGKYYDVITMDILENEFKEDVIKNKNV